MRASVVQRQRTDAWPPCGRPTRCRTRTSARSRGPRFLNGCRADAELPRDAASVMNSGSDGFLGFDMRLTVLLRVSERAAHSWRMENDRVAAARPTATKK